MAAAVIGEQAARGAVQPVERLLPVGNVVEATPGGRERLGDDVGGVVTPLRRWA